MRITAGCPLSPADLPAEVDTVITDPAPAEVRRGDVAGARQAMRSHVNMVADIGLLRWSAVQPDS